LLSPELHPNDERWTRNLATAYDNKGDIESAIAGLNRLVERCPASADLRWQLEYYRSKTSTLGKKPSSGPDSTIPHGGSTASIAASAGGNKSEFEKDLDLKQKLAEIEAKDRERRRIDHALRSRPGR
jgi:hypothetical protein